MESISVKDIVAKLDELSEMRAAADVARLDYEAKRAEILKAVQAELDALDAEYQPRLDTVNVHIAALEDEVRDIVRMHGASVRGSRIQAVYARGRVSWDTRSLDRYTRDHPEVARFRKEGPPTVSLRTRE